MVKLTPRSVWLLASIAILALFIYGCSSGRPDAAGMEAPSEAVADVATERAQTGEAGAAPQKIALERKIIYTGHVSLVTEDLDEVAKKLEVLIRQHRAYISSASKNGQRGTERVAEWTIRIPSDRFDAFLQELPNLGELQSSSRQAQDVSEEFYDVEARLRNKKAEEQRLIELLKNATGKLSEVLTVEKELSRVREEIERIEGRLRFLRDQTAYSTITVTVREVENYQPAGPPTILTQVSRAFSASLGALKDFATSLLLVIVAVLPWLVPLGILAWLLRLGLRNKPPRK